MEAQGFLCQWFAADAPGDFPVTPSAICFPRPPDLFWLSCRLQDAAPVMPDIPSCPVQACRRPASRLPPAPRGLPHEPPGHRRTRAAQRDRLGPLAYSCPWIPVPGATSLHLDAPGTGLMRITPSCLRDAPDDRCAATGPPLRQAVLSCCPVPADFAAFGLPVLGRCGRLRDRKTSGRFARPRKHDFELRAVGRQTLRADCLGPPASLSLPAPGATPLREDAPDRGL